MWRFSHITGSSLQLGGCGAESSNRTCGLLQGCTSDGAPAQDEQIFTAIIPVTVTLCTANKENKEHLQTAQWSLFSAMHLHNSVCTSGQKQRLGREGTAEARAACDSLCV